MDVFQAISDRQSIRKYDNRDVENKKLEKVAQAFRMAPSAKNLQNKKLLVVKDQKTKELIRLTSPSKAGMLSEAPAILIAVGFDKGIMTCGHRADTIDLSIAMSFALLEAFELGLGTCWMANYKEEELKAVLGLPEEASIVAISPIGYAKEIPPKRGRKPLSEVYELRE